MSHWLKAKVIGVLRGQNYQQALHSAQVTLENGLEVIEVTFTTPDTPKLIAELRSQFPSKSIGAGSITHLGQAEAAIEAGAHFFVSPHFDHKLSQWFKDKNKNYIPGGMTPTELLHIKNHGHEFQKLFPAMIIRPEGIKNILAPLPDLQLIVTGGVNLINAQSYLDAGAKAICVGGNLFSNKMMLPENTDALAAEAKKWAQL